MRSTTTPQATTIDMFNPAETAAILATDESGILGLVNSGTLPAYNLGGHIRFRVADVNSLADQLVAA